MSAFRRAYVFSLPQSQRAPLPRPPSRVLALTKPVTFFGNLLTAANFWLGQVRHIFITTPLTTDERQRLEG